MEDQKKPLAIFGHFQLMSNFSEAFTVGGKPLHLKTAPRHEFFLSSHFNYKNEYFQLPLFTTFSSGGYV